MRVKPDDHDEDNAQKPAVDESVQFLPFSSARGNRTTSGLTAHAEQTPKRSLSIRTAHLHGPSGVTQAFDGVQPQNTHAGSKICSSIMLGGGATMCFKRLSWF